MNGKDLLSRLILSLNTYLEINDPVVNENIEIDEDISEAIRKLQGHPIPPTIDSFLNSINKIYDQNLDNFLANPYTVLGDVNIIDFSKRKFDKKNRKFAYAGVEFGFFSSKALFETGNLVDFSEEHFGILWKHIQEFCERCYFLGKLDKLTQLFDCIRDVDSTKGFVINRNSLRFKDERHYSYIYLSFLNDSHSILPSSELVYGTPKLSNSLSLISVRKYEQFFDIYDVLNELNQESNILSRFLKLYHTLEYLVYRMELVNLVNRVETNKILVREFVSASENMKKSEKDNFKKNFNEIFKQNKTFIKTELDVVTTPDIVNYLSKKNIVNGFITNDLSIVALLVYGLRNCIVHNKESEFHITISNHEEYGIIIPLIKQLIKVFEDLVIQKLIEMSANSKILYPQRTFNLY